jgi:hypothetical protein
VRTNFAGRVESLTGVVGGRCESSARARRDAGAARNGVAAMLATPDKMLCLALALTAVLAMAPGREDPVFLWDRANSAPAGPSWLPWLLLAGLAVASAFFGLARP